MGGASVRLTVRSGVTLIECVLATVILGVSIVAGLSAASGAAATNRASAQRLLASRLADEVLERALALPYSQSGSNRIGPDAGETRPAHFNDVDDFDGWTESPPQTIAGTTMAGLDGWNRTVTVSWVRPNAIDTQSASETGLKRVVVAVSVQKRVVARAVGFAGAAP